MRLTDFDYNLPAELIAQYPSDRRGDDRLLVLDRDRGSFEEAPFGEIAGFFRRGDLLVLNDTRVIPARIYGKRRSGGRVEIFVIDRTKAPVEALVRPSGRIKDGETIELDSGDQATVMGRTGIGRLVEFHAPVDDVIMRAGRVPLPPYISRPAEKSDEERYQTIYARHEGATASPTAGLHFTDEIFNALDGIGVERVFVTLHVSYGTFAPVKTDEVELHKMHSEYYRISGDSLLRIKKAKNDKRRVIACGTTSVRALETCADRIDDFMEGADRYGEEGPRELSGFSDMFIYPGYRFRVVNAMITNFHLPKSTLMLLTGAFAGRDLLFKAYEYAIGAKFRFFSYGDAMMIV
ncbi:MAG: tRNA preQ1(34) S-adenosylmethionine ribosyltransferase-isomerase QueA [Candidatus Omnitrophota bacterium]